LVLSAASSQFKTTSIRSHGIIGLNDTNIVPLLAAAPRNISLGPGTNLFDFSSANNVALAHALAVENLLSSSTDPKKSANGKAFFVTDERPLQLRQITDMVWDCLDHSGVQNNTLTKRTFKFVIPIPIAYCIIWLLSFLAKLMGKEPKLSTSELGDSVSVRYFNNSRAREVLGYVPVAKLEDSIRDACKTYKERNSSPGT
jgi:sterol-4alpha-carboxylate 3-dehydrogenase (decarboxylating)